MLSTILLGFICFLAFWLVIWSVIWLVIRLPDDLDSIGGMPFPKSILFRCCFVLLSISIFIFLLFK